MSEHSSKADCESAIYLRTFEPYITGAATTCSYCDHLSPLILQEGRYTYITLAIGQIVEGYLQICTQKHRTAATGLYLEETRELEQMKAIVRASYDIVYGCRGIAFEHGQAGSCQWGSEAAENLGDLCHHMHIHFLPVSIDIRERIGRLCPECFVVRSLDELKQVRGDELRGGPYLYFEGVDETGYVYPTRKLVVPRQFLRSCVAEELGMPSRSDWKKVTGIEHMAESRSKLQPVLAEQFKEVFG